MLQNARVTAFTVSKLLTEDKQGEITPSPTPRLGLRSLFISVTEFCISKATEKV